MSAIGWPLAFHPIGLTVPLVPRIRGFDLPTRPAVWLLPG